MREEKNDLLDTEYGKKLVMTAYGTMTNDEADLLFEKLQKEYEEKKKNGEK